MSERIELQILGHPKTDEAPRPIAPSVEVLEAVQALVEARPEAGVVVIDQKVNPPQQRFTRNVTLDRLKSKRTMSVRKYEVRKLKAGQYKLVLNKQSPERSLLATAARDALAVHDVVAVFPNLGAKYVAALKEVLPTLVRATERSQREAAMKRFEERVKGLEMLYPEVEPLADPRLERIADALELQQEFMQSEPVLTSADIAQRAGHSDRNPSYTASRWRKEKKIFGVRYRGKEFYPAFQFDDAGQPYRLLKPLLEIFDRNEGMTDWDIAMWFTTPSGLLAGEIPKILLSSRSAETEQRLVTAAEQEAAFDGGG